MRIDQERYLQSSIGPATRSLAEKVFEARLRPLIVMDTDQDTVEVLRFMCILSFVYGVKAGGEGGGLLDG